MKKRVTALDNSLSLDQLCDAVASKLAQRFEGQVLPKQDVEGSNPFTRFHMNEVGRCFTTILA